MPSPRKVFRIEQMNATSAPAVIVSDHAAASRQQDEILAALRALHALIERQTQATHKSDGGEIETRELQRLKDETGTIHRAISHTKHEIATLHVSTFNEVGRPRVTRELDAVADGTERATKQILDAAEVIEEAASSLSASVRRGQEQALAQDIQDHVVRIFEACNFQDLSGQRIAKVLSTLKFVEDRIVRMMEIWGGAEAFRTYAAEASAERARTHDLMHGPQLAGDAGHASQDEIDQMFATR